MAGNVSTSPWNFESFDLLDINVSVDGIPAYGNPIRLNFEASAGID